MRGRDEVALPLNRGLRLCNSGNEMERKLKSALKKAHSSLYKSNCAAEHLYYLTLNIACKVSHNSNTFIPYNILV